MKKIISALFLVCLLSTPVFAENEVNGTKDVTTDFWAKQSIECVVSNSIMNLDEAGNFNPDKEITRAEFVQALLKILSNDNLNIEVKNAFTDIQESDAFYADILRSQQLGLVYGYPDGTFQPNKTMLRSEIVSVISHITKDKYIDCSILNQFTDKEDIESWAKLPYAKTIHYGIYVNYPDENKLEPNRNITRAEVAVILAKLKDKLTVVKSEYVGPKEECLSVEHFNYVENVVDNKVQITNLRKIINKGNVFPIAYERKFDSSAVAQGDVVNFVFPKGLSTDEGSLIIPQGSKLVAEVSVIEPPQKYNQEAKVAFDYKQIVLPDGTTYDIQAKTNTLDNYLKVGTWAKIRKTLTIIGIFTNGLNYNAKEGQEINVMLLEEVAFPNAQKMVE